MKLRGWNISHLCKIYKLCSDNSQWQSVVSAGSNHILQVLRKSIIFITHFSIFLSMYTILGKSFPFRSNSEQCGIGSSRDSRLADSRLDKKRATYLLLLLLLRSKFLYSQSSSYILNHDLTIGQILGGGDHTLTSMNTISSSCS